MEWYVFKYNCGLKTIAPYNIFNHWRFSNDVQEALNLNSRDKFEAELNNIVLYYFWCKAEYEIIISPWCRTKNDNDIKIDIYSQIKLNWKIFVDYVWSFRQVHERKE